MRVELKTRFCAGRHVRINDNIWTLLFYLYLCHLLEFNSHLTGYPRSTEITNDYSLSGESSTISSHLPNMKEIRKEMWTVGR